MVTLSGSGYGLRVLNALHRAGYLVLMVVVLSDAFARKWRLLRRVARQIGWTDAVQYALEWQWRSLTMRRAEGLPIQDYEQLGAQVIVTPSLHSLPLEQALNDAGVDLLLLGQSGIVPPNLLVIPRLGTLNAHPGMLPAYRGIDCHWWASWRREFDQIGSTLHRVDAGVDTGAIVQSRPYRWTGTETAHNLLDQIYEDCVDLLIEGVRQAADGKLQATPQPRGPYYHKLPRRLLPAVDAHLREFLADIAWRSQPFAR